MQDLASPWSLPFAWIPCDLQHIAAGLIQQPFGTRAVQGPKDAEEQVVLLSEAFSLAQEAGHPASCFMG
jgi:hypothetical protein